MAYKLDKYFSDTKIPSNLDNADIRAIKEWLSKQPHLPELSDRQIAIFLHSCFGALELTKNTIDSYYTIRTHAPELFNGRNPKEVKETSKVVYAVVLDQLALDGSRLVSLGVVNPDPSAYNLVGFLRFMFSTLDILYSEYSFDEGLRLLYNFTGTGFGHLTKLSPTVLKKAFTFVSKLAEISLEKEHLLVAGLYDENSDKFNLAKVLRMVLCFIDIEGFLSPDAAGWRVIISAKGFSFGHLTKITANMGVLKKMIYYVQDGLPLRLKGIHIFNAIPLVNQFLAVIRPIMKKELFELIHIHSTNDTESLFKYIPKESLPSDFGGQAPSLDELIKSSNKKIEKYKQWFVDDDKLGRVDETKRVGKAKNSGDIFGIDGSFKKLDFD